MRSDTGYTMAAEECWDLISGQSLGRLGLSIDALPVVFPVQYYIDQGRVAICLGHHRVPGQAVDHTVAAFTVDNLIDPTSPGWTVYIAGLVAPPQPLTDCDQPGAGKIVHLTPVSIKGQRTWLCPLL